MVSPEAGPRSSHPSVVLLGIGACPRDWRGCLSSASAVVASSFWSCIFHGLSHLFFFCRCSELRFGSRFVGFFSPLLIQPTAGSCYWEKVGPVTVIHTLVRSTLGDNRAFCVRQPFEGSLEALDKNAGTWLFAEVPPVPHVVSILGWPYWLPVCFQT